MVPAANVISGCVPVNLFGGPGSVTPDQVPYLELPLRDQGQNSQRMAELSAEGTWGSILGKPVYWATGAAYLREAGYYRLDPLRAGGTAGSGLQADVPGGGFDSKELYAEARVPLGRTYFVDVRLRWN
jgi:iron complex outermembrane receptor protein